MAIITASIRLLSSAPILAIMESWAHPIMASLPDPAFRAIAERLQTRPSLFIEDRL